MKDIKTMAQEARTAANSHPNQGSYDAGYLQGYANALEKLAEPSTWIQVVQAYERMCLREDAAWQLAEYFGIDPDNPDEASAPDAWRNFKDAIGCTYVEACSEGEETYILDVLVDRFEKYNDCSVAVNDTWHNVIWAFIDDRK